MHINVFESIKELEHLVKNSKLTELERDRYKLNIHAIHQVATEWQKQKSDAQEDKRLNG